MTESNPLGPRVDVIIPTYNRTDKLKRAVASVCDQTYKIWNLYVINDAPDHDVGHLLPNDERITYVQHKENKGAPTTRNTGIQMSTAPYIALLDDDDAWKPAKLKRQINVFQELNQDYGLVYTGRHIIKHNSIIKTQRPDISGDVFHELLHGNFIASETPMIKRACFKRVGYFDTELQSSQDFDMWLRIARDYKISAIPEPLAVAYQGHEDRISKNMDRKYEGKKRILDKYWDDLESYPPAISKHMKQLGVYELYLNRPAEARENFIQSFVYDKTQVTPLCYAFMTLLPRNIRVQLLRHL